MENINILTTGQNSFNCQEESDYPVADSYIYAQDHIVNRQEEAINMPLKGYKQTEEHKAKLRPARLRYKPSEDANRKDSDSNKGDKNPMFGRGHTKETKQKMKENHADFSGNKNPFYKKKHTEKIKERIRQAMLGKKLRLGCILTKIHKEKIRQANIGEKNANWNGGTSFLPYCYKFNDELKERIRNRDNRTCQLCPCTEEENGKKLSVHHIHYDKPNCEPDLISLCNACNMKVNFNRDHWEKHFMNILRERGLVRK